MKKTFTLSLAVAAAASAYAIAPQQAAPVALDSHKMQLSQPVEMVQPVANVSAELSSRVSAKSATLKALPEGAVLTNFYKNPAGGYVASNSFTMDGGTYIYPIMVLPAYADNVYENWSYYATDEGLHLVDDEISYVWNYWDFDMYAATSSDKDLTVKNQPYIVKGLMMDAPALTVDNDTVYELPHGVIYGGKGEIPQYFIDGTGITGVTENGVCPYDRFADGFHTIFRSGSFGKDANASGSGWDYYASQFEEFTVSGMAQTFDKPAAPYALSSITVYALLQCEAGATLNATFYKIDDEGNLTNEIIASKDIKITEAYNSLTTNQYYPLVIDFTTEDEFGFEVDYQMIDCAMVMVLTGYENNSLISEFDIPVVGFLNDSPTAIVGPGNFYAMCTASSGGQTLNGLLDFPYAFYTDATQTELMVGMSMNILMELEYPYLQTIQNLETGNAFPIQKTHDISLAAGEDIYMAVFCSGSAADIMVPDCPEWLEMLIEDRTQDVGGMAGEYVEVAFAVSADATNVGEASDVTLSYKGCEQTYHITHAPAGVDNVAKDNVEVVAVEYYNIQGQKLNAAPENGIFIQKNIKADGSINNVKVVK